MARGPKAILVAGDEEMVLEVRREMVGLPEYRVYAARSAQEAPAAHLKRGRIFAWSSWRRSCRDAERGDFRSSPEDQSRKKVLLSSGYSISGNAKTVVERSCNAFSRNPSHLEVLSRKVREMPNRRGRCLLSGNPHLNAKLKSV